MTRRCIRDLWTAEVLCTKRIHDSCRVLLLHLAVGAHRDGDKHASDKRVGEPLMTATGYVRNVWHEDLATHLGINEKQVGRRLKEAREQGLLVIVGGGHNGQPTMYAAQLQGHLKTPAEGGPSGTAGSLRDFVKPPAHKGPSQVAERGPSAVTATSPSVTKTPAEEGPYVRAHARAPYKHREQEPAPADGRGPTPHHPPTSSSNGDRAAPDPSSTATPSPTTSQTRESA